MNDKVNFPANALPLDADMLDRVQQFDSKALYWLSGYCSGLADAKGHGLAEASSSAPLDQIVGQNTHAAAVALKTVVLYASQSGECGKGRSIAPC